MGKDNAKAVPSAIESSGAPKKDKAGLTVEKPGEGQEEARIAKGLGGMELLATSQSMKLTRSRGRYTRH